MLSHDTPCFKRPVKPLEAECEIELQLKSAFPFSYCYPKNSMYFINDALFFF